MTADTVTKQRPENRRYAGTEDTCYTCEMGDVQQPGEPVALSWTREERPDGGILLVDPAYLCAPCARQARGDDRYHLEEI